MVGTEADTGVGCCKFPNVRKTYWRSASWTAQSPAISTLHRTRDDDGTGCSSGEGIGAIMQGTPPSPNHLQNSRVKPLLKPLSITKKSLCEWPKAGSDDMIDWTSSATPGCRRVKIGPDIKLDLTSVQRYGVEPTEIQLKRDKLAHFDKQCSRVANHHIYLGSDAVARDRGMLLANGITHVLNCVGFVCPEYFKQEFVYKTLWLQDSPCEDITSVLYDVFDYFEDARKEGGQVFVHCCQGVSRSTSLVIAYLMWRDQRSFEDAFQDVRAARGVTNPNMGFVCQLLQCQKRVHATPMSPNSMVRMYRLAPHSPYDPLHLVPKAINKPGAGALDTRGTFILHASSAMFVWIGKDCDSNMALAAQGAADQLLRYERAVGPPLIAVEGEEGVEFWKLFKNHLGEVNAVAKTEATSVIEQSFSGVEPEKVRTAGVDSKKVPLYDTDFELYQIACQGGVLPPVPYTTLDVATKPICVPARDDGWSMLRCKFVSGELVAMKESEECKDNTQSVLTVPLPGISMNASSHFSPFSVTSLATSGSPFVSPLVFPNDSSTATQGSTTSVTVLAAPDIPPFCSLHRGGLPRLAKHEASSSPALQRDSDLLALRFPNLSDDPPPAPRSMSRKLRLPPLITKGNLGVHYTEDEFKESCSSLKKDSAEICNAFVSGKNHDGSLVVEPEVLASKLASSGSICQLSSSSKTYPMLYRWPGLEKIDMFDADDLDMKAIYLLYASHLDGSNGCDVVYVWIGHEYCAKDVGSSSIFQKVGDAFLELMRLPADTSIQIVREGQEHEDFWNHFKDG